MTGKLKRFYKKKPGRVSPLADRLGIGRWLRQTYVNTRLMGERAKFAWVGGPDPTSAILMAGSGRSGTTWITDVLCALPGVQQIFEPLFPLWNERVRQITGWDMSNPYIRSIYLHPEENNLEWNELWGMILTGRLRNYWTDYERSSWFPDRFMIKEIRANMMLGYIYRQFQLSIIYIMRHPCAVVHSRLAAPQPWHADVQDILQQANLVADHLFPFVADIEKETDLLGAHAVWWAVENHVALSQLRVIPHYLVFYEDLVSRPREVLASLLPWLGVETIPEEVLSLLPRSSRMSNERLDYQDAQDRLSRWQVSLSIADQRRILAWGERLGLNMYDTSCYPRLGSYAHAN